MKFKELAAILNVNTDVYLMDEEYNLIDKYDGKNSIDPKYGEYEVIEVSHHYGDDSKKAVDVQVQYISLAWDMECIRCPRCGKPLMAMEPFYDTEENEWNYQCDDCGFDITIFVK